MYPSFTFLCSPVALLYQESTATSLTEGGILCRRMQTPTRFFAFAGLMTRPCAWAPLFASIIIPEIDPSALPPCRASVEKTSATPRPSRPTPQLGRAPGTASALRLSDLPATRIERRALCAPRRHALSAGRSKRRRLTAILPPFSPTRPCGAPVNPLPFNINAAQYLK